MHVLDGGLIGVGLLFVSVEMVMPVVIKSLSGSPYIISLMPVVSVLGVSLPALLFAHHWQRLPRLLPISVTMGFIQRLMYLVGAAVLFLFGKNPAVAVAVVALCPLISNLASGVSINAWQEVVAKTIPPERRSSLWAARAVIASVGGIAVGLAVERILKWQPNSNGYALLHLIMFVFSTASVICLSRMRELPSEPHHLVELTLAQNLRRVPDLILRQKRVLYYVLAGAGVAGLYIALPWLGIHALKVLGKSESFMGYLLTAFNLGAIVGNLAAGYAGDRLGGKIVCLVSRVGYLVVCLWAMSAMTQTEFYIIYTILGACWYANGVGAQTLELEICPYADRPSYLAIIAAVRVPSVLLAALSSVWLWQAGGRGFTVPALAAAAAMAVAIVFTTLIREPRERKEISRDTGDARDKEKKSSL